MDVKGDEVEILCRELDSTLRVNIPMENMTTMIGLMFHKNTLENDPEFNQECDAKMQGEKILKSRIEVLGYKITNLAVLFTTLLMNELVPGNLVIYANFIAYKAKINGIKTIRLDDVLDWFPAGGFSKTALQNFWDKQKYEHGNMVDHIEPTKSLMYENN